MDHGSKRKRIHIVLVGPSKTLTETIAGPCVCTMHMGVQLTSQRAILSFSNILVWTVENESKWWCGRKSTDAFLMTTKMCYCGQGQQRSKKGCASKAICYFRFYDLSF